MTLLVSYDISHNKTRKQVADYLLYIGLLRIQQSVFMGFITIELRNKLEQAIEKIMSGDTTDRIFFIPIHQNSLKKASFRDSLTKDLQAEIAGIKKVLIF